MLLLLQLQLLHCTDAGLLRSSTNAHTSYLGVHSARDAPCTRFGLQISEQQAAEVPGKAAEGGQLAGAA
jgi:hypothetical protein